jgi:hypothetical protein
MRVMGYMPELNALCAISDYSEQSKQPFTKQIVVEVTPAAAGPTTWSVSVTWPFAARPRGSH